jgi:tRNA(Ile)-lysidine synthase
MVMDIDPARVVPEAVRRAARAADAPLLLAVSGGLDSMALLAGASSAAHARVAAVATFDHGTGPAATEAAAHVARAAAAMGFPVVVGRMPAAESAPDGWEAAWRNARHAFLARTAAELGARVATAHTEDDQVETVLMRVMRGAGARGLAGLEAPSPIVRPFLRLRRGLLESFLRQQSVAWVHDPSNDSAAFLRNRVRHDLLPALRRASPTIDAELLATGRAAAAWRIEVDALVERVVRPRPGAGGGVSVAPEELAGYDRDSVSMIWGALAAQAGLALDRRGTHRLATFIMKRPRRGSIPLSGGWCLEARPDAFLLRRSDRFSAAPATLPLAGTVEWGRFRFRASTHDDGPAGTWTASFPAGAVLQVRSWADGDRLAAAGGQARRRVTRYLSAAGVRGSDRREWPVVVPVGEGAGDVVWIPGVRRSDAATERSGRPVRHYVCERIDS